MAQLRKARPGEEGAVAALWAAVYGDDGGFLENFYRLCTPFSQVTVLEEEGAIRTILTAPRVTLRLPDGREEAAGYMYALASDPTVRCRGYGRDMMRFGARCLKEEGAKYAVLVPAEPSLFRFFHSLDYVPAFSHLRREIPREACLSPCGEDGIFPAGAAEYNAIRKGWLEGRLYMSCTDDTVEFQRYLARESGGDIYRLTLPNGEGCAVAELYGDTPVIKELLCAEEDIPRAVALLACRHPAAEYVLRLPPWTKGEGERVLWGAVLPLQPDGLSDIPKGTDGYLGIALD